MKKIFTFFVALLATMTFAFAQNLLSESFDNGVIPTGWTTIDADGDNYTWDANLPYVNSFETHSGAGCISSQSYINNVGALTPDNWLISPQITLSGAATLTFYAWGQDASYYAENFGVYVSTTGTTPANFTSVLQATTTHAITQYTVDLSAYAGQSVYIAFRHYNVTDMYILNLDDVVVFAHPTTPTITAAPAALTFATTPAGDVTAAQTVAVAGYVLGGNNITATTAAPFEVSADNAIFGTTATLDSVGGTLYVRYAPTAAGTHSGAVTLTSGTATAVTVSLTGVGIDCSAAISSFPYTEDFETGVPPMCWSVVGNSDTTWTSYVDGTNTLASILHNTSPIQEENLITKAFDFSNNNNAILMDFIFRTSYAYTQMHNGTDSIFNVTILASVDGGQTWGTTPLWSLQDVQSEFANWAVVPATVDLTSLAGQSNVKLMFKYYAKTIGAQFLMDDIEIYTYDNPTIVTATNALSFYAEEGQTETKTALVSGYVLSADMTATTAAPFEVSADGTNFGTTATLGTGHETLYVRYTGTVGTQTGTVTISSTGAQDVTIALNAIGYNCDNISFPLTENFNAGVVPPSCWTVVYGNNDPSVNPVSPVQVDEAGTDFAFAFNSYNNATDYTQYLISPEIPYDGAMNFALQAACYSTLFGPSPETFMLGYSTTTNDVDAFTWSDEFTADQASFTNFNISVPAGTKHVAVKYTSEYMYYLFIDNVEITAGSDPSAIEELAAQVSVYPNPSKDVVNINTTAQINFVDIYSVAGQKLSTINVNNATAQINVADLAAGIYFLQINTENGMVVKKINVVK